MEAKKDIGKAIREKLDSPDRQPNDALWGAISQSLDENDKKKKKFPFFWFYIISCTVIGVTAIAFVLSNLAGTDKNNIDIKPDGIENATLTGSSITNESSASDKNNRENTSLSSKTSESKGDSIESVSGNKNTVNKNNAAVSVGTSTQKSKGLESKKLQSKNQLNSSDDEDYASGSKYDTNTKYRRQSAKSGKTIATNTGQTAGNSNGKQALSYAQTGKKTATSRNTAPSADFVNNSNNNSHNTVSQTGNKPVAVNTTPIAKSGANDTNNTSSGKVNISSSIESKNIGTLDNDSTKTVADSLKTPIADIKDEEKKEDKKDSIPPVPFKKFSVFAYGGPSYFSFPDRTIVTDSTTSNINTKSTTRFGAMFGYRFNHKLSVRTGISVYKLKQSAKNLKLNYTMESTGTEIGIMPPDNFTWVDYTAGVSNGFIIDVLATVSENNYAAVINIDRELSYVEIPLELGYNLFDKRFGVDVFGGGSILLLNKNKVTAYNEMGQMYLGEWNAAAKTSFTGTIGLGMHYKFTPSLQLNAEPVFSYYFNTYKDSKPYSFTFRLGLQYNFDF